jgi:hypothetical protein
MADIFTKEEMLHYGMTPWKYATIKEKDVCQHGETVSIWDYKENHERFRLVVDGKEQVFNPYFPLFVSEIADG